MVRNHHRIAPAVVLAIALAAATPAAAKFDLNPQPATDGSPASAAPAPCSEVCSAGGYTLHHVRIVAVPASASQGAYAGPRSEVVSGGGYATPAPTVIRVASPSSGFDWGDAGIGAGGAIAVMVLVGGAVLGTSSTRRRAARPA